MPAPKAGALPVWRRPNLSILRRARDTSVWEVEPESDRQKHGHLPARDGVVRAVVPAAAASRDACGRERFDESEERVAGRNVVERRDGGCRADLALPDDPRLVETHTDRVEADPNP